MNHSHLKSENKLESLLSRESSFLFNNLLLLAACFTVLWGTLFPVLSEWVQGTKVTVGAPFFNKVEVPIAMLLLLLTGMGPLLAWRKTSVESLKRNFAIPLILGVATAVLLIGIGVRPWVDMSYFYSLVAISLAVMVAATIFSEFYRGGRVIASHTGRNIFASMVQLTRRNTRRYGGYVVHFGVVLIMIGLAGAAFNRDKEQEMNYGDKLQIGSYTLLCRSYTQDDTDNYFTESAIIDVFKNGKQITTMFPERRVYHASNQPATIVANHSTLQEDLYLIYAGQSESGRPIIKARINPLVIWVWIGLLVTVGGTVLALVPNMAAAKVTRVVPATARVPQHAVGAGD
jgi:cytochrome c-type biogenesis protein CcmF